MQKISDNTLLDLLKREDNASFTTLYQCCFPTVAAYILNNHGKKEDAEDIFQEAVIVLLQKVRTPDFQLTASLRTYLFSISRNLWLKQLRDNKLIPMEDMTIYQPAETLPTLSLHPEKSREEKVQSWISRITGHCQRILKAIFIYQEPMDLLMKKMGWKNKHTAANQQYKCLQQIKKFRQKEEGIG
ncbi:RNA polymerase sigma factor [Chitinophaga dinghuensis]|nr:sigma-70 family RNA polymerase sigma factor [Chitinophaga dinghuensis]